MYCSNLLTLAMTDDAKRAVPPCSSLIARARDFCHAVHELSTSVMPKPNRGPEVQVSMLLWMGGIQRGKLEIITMRDAVNADARYAATG